MLRTRGNAVLQSSWDIDVVKRVAKDTLGTKASSFSGSEPHRQLLWDSLVTALEASFINKDSANEDIFDLVDVTKEVHPIFNDILLRALVSLTTPHSPARRWVDASARISPRDGKRALLEITKRLLPPGHRPLRHHEELLGITFGSSNDPEPLVAQFDECLKAIAASGAGPLDDEAAKRQLLAALDADFYKEVITPLRLDTELAKVSIEEVYTHVLEVWWGANPNGPPTRPNTAAPIHTHTPLGLAYAGDEQSGISDFLEEFARIIGEASTLLASLRSDEREVARDTPPPRNDFPRRHGGGGVKFPPSKWRDERNRRTDGKFHGRNRHVGWKHRFAASTLPKGGNWPQGMKPQGARSISFHSASSAFVQECPLCPGHFHDTARCPMVCGSCDVGLCDAAMDLDEIVSAFQTAFDEENDEDFADLCHVHDQPLVRNDPEPFTYPVRHDVGLRAHYAGLGHGASGDGMEGVLSDARGVLESLRSAAAAAQVGGAGAAETCVGSSFSAGSGVGSEFVTGRTAGVDLLEEEEVRHRRIPPAKIKAVVSGRKRRRSARLTALVLGILDKDTEAVAEAKQGSRRIGLGILLTRTAVAVAEAKRKAHGELCLGILDTGPDEAAEAKRKAHAFRSGDIGDYGFDRLAQIIRFCLSTYNAPHLCGTHTDWCCRQSTRGA
ncbi:hypothetical protein CYMTET_46332 [Cymbomonas tetramitiformis]|uniref:Uncharacterized protein n=1 Tax=Cymbomonas tetramitiformis TaxID=36881 RepID=A0AAE0EXQ3_9CHLO|nr:hypothetical protein CYMTET_46332 [Cymbomonas tetramitiformis]